MNKLIPAVFSFLGMSMFFSCRHKNSFVTATDEKSLLWEISGKELTKPSYFFGTMHLLCAEDTELNQTIKMLIRAVDQIYLEVDLDNASELLGGILDLRRKNGKDLKS